MSKKNRILELNCVAASMLQQGRYRDAMKLASQALKLSKCHLNELSPLMAASLYNVAECQFRYGMYESAKENHERALQIRHRLTPKAQDDVAQSLNALAACHVKLLDYQSAENCFREALSIRQALGNDFGTGIVSMNLGDMYSDLQDFAKANENYTLALHTFQKSDNPQVLAICLNDLALLYQNNRMYKEASDYYLAAINIYELHGPAAYFDLSITLNNLGALQQSLLQYDKALSSLHQSLKLSRHFHRDDHSEIVNGTLRLAHLFRYLGRFDNAERLYSKLLTDLEKGGGGDVENIAVCLGGLAEIHRLRGEYLEAEPLYRQALEKVRDTRTNVEGQLLNDLGIFYNNLSRNKDATEMLLKSRDIFADAVGLERKSYVQTLCNLGVVATSNRHFQQAESFLKESLDATSLDLGKKHPSYAISLQNLGVLYREFGRYAEGESAFREAIPILTSILGHWHPNVAAAFQNLGELRRECGSYISAEKLFHISLKIRRKAFGDEHLEVAHARHALAGIYGAKGDHQHEKILLLEVLGIEKGFKVENESLATTLSNLGLCCSNLGQYADAEEYLLKSLKIRRHLFGESHPEVAYSLRHLGRLYGKLADAESELKYITESYNIMLNFYGEENMHSLIGLEYLADFHAAAGLTDQALPIYEQILQMKMKIVPPDDIEVGDTLLDIGNCLIMLGKLVEAKAKIVESMEIIGHRLGCKHPNYSAVLFALAKLNMELGNYDEAEREMDMAAAVIENAFGKGHPSFGTCLFYRGVLRVAQGRTDDGLQLFGQACDIDSDILGLVLRIGSDRRRLLFLQSIRAYMESYLSLISRSPHPAPTSIQKAFDLVLRRKGLVTESLAEQREALLSGRYKELAGDLRVYEDVRQTIIGLTLAPSDLDGAENRRKEIARLREQFEEVEAALARKIPEVSLDRWMRYHDFRNISNELPPGSALVEYLRAGCWGLSARSLKGVGWQSECDHYFAFVLRGPNDLDMIDLGEAENIDRAIISFRNAVAGNETDSGTSQKRYFTPPTAVRTEVWADCGARLRSLIFDPLLPTLDGRIRLFLAPDGELTRVPFEALPVSAGCHLIDQYLISYLSTGRDLLRVKAALTLQAAEPLVAADPDFDLCSADFGASTANAAEVRTLAELRRAGFPLVQLEGAHEEGKRVAEILGVKPLLGAEVLEAEIKSYRSPRILHLATHGVFLSDPGRGSPPLQPISLLVGREDRLEQLSRLENPLLRSFLALAGANTWLRGQTPPDAAQDGLLTAEDVSGLDLMGTQLVVLSACDTALGAVYAGEGVFGLRRAFTLAGARTLVMSQWKVPDKETCELMGIFYRRLLAGEGRAEALRGAQLAIKSRKADPRFWGAFICQGDPGPLTVV